MGGQRLRVQLDLARRRGEAGVGVLAVSRRQRHPDAGRVGAELLEGDPARRELVAERRVDVAVPEVLAQAEARGEVEDDLQVRAGLAARRDERPAQLDEGLRRLAALEPDLQCLGLERRRHRQHDVGELGGRVHEQVGVHEEVEAASASRPRALSRVGHDQVGAEADQRLDPPLERRGVEVLAGHELEARRTERSLVTPIARWTGADRSSIPSIGLDGTDWNSTFPPGTSKLPVRA